MTSIIFRDQQNIRIQENVKELLNNQETFLSASTAKSTRAIGDAIQDILGRCFGEMLGDICVDYSAEFARRAMADMAFNCVDQNYYVVDVKTHCEQTKFNMPNLISVERLARFYQDDKNYFCLLIVKYSLDGTKIHVSEVLFIPLEFLHWECLTIGALGWGQIQIANSNRIIIDDTQTRKQWMLALCDVMEEFYPKEISKIAERIGYFQKVREYWLAKE